MVSSQRTSLSYIVSKQIPPLAIHILRRYVQGACLIWMKHGTMNQFEEHAEADSPTESIIVIILVTGVNIFIYLEATYEAIYIRSPKTNILQARVVLMSRSKKYVVQRRNWKIFPLQFLALRSNSGTLVEKVHC